MPDSPQLDPPSAHDLWARIAHDLRQPIQALLLLTHVMAATDAAAQRQQTGKSIEDMLVALQDMLDQVALLARLESGSEHARPAPCSMPELVSQVSEQLADALAENSAEIETKCTAATITTDVRLLETALGALILNALKLRTEGPVTLTCGRRRGGYRLEIAFAAPPVSSTQLRALFIEFPRRRGGAVLITPVAGPAFIARLAHHLGGSLEHKSLPDGRQRLALVLTPSAK